MKSIITSIKNNPKADRELNEKYQLDVEVFFNPDHEKFNDIYQLPVDEKDQVLKIIKLKGITRLAILTGTWLGYCIGRSVLRRNNYFPTFMKYSRFVSIPVYIIGIGLISLNEEKELINTKLQEYKFKRDKFEVHKNLLKKVLKPIQDESLYRGAYEENKVSIKQMINEQGKQK